MYVSKYVCSTKENVNTRLSGKYPDILNISRNGSVTLM